jgi:hypothetical protein
MLSQLTVDPYLNATGGLPLSLVASGEDFANPKLPLPKAGFDLHEGKLEAPTFMACGIEACPSPQALCNAKLGQNQERVMKPFQALRLLACGALLVAAAPFSLGRGDF